MVYVEVIEPDGCAVDIWNLDTEAEHAERPTHWVLSEITERRIDRISV